MIHFRDFTRSFSPSNTKDVFVPTYCGLGLAILFSLAKSERQLKIECRTCLDYDAGRSKGLIEASRIALKDDNEHVGRRIANKILEVN